MERRAAGAFHYLSIFAGLKTEVMDGSVSLLLGVSFVSRA